LFELLLVLAILAVLVGLSWPQLMSNLKDRSVEGTAEQVRQLLDHARVRAIEEGRTLQVLFEASGRRFVMLPEDPFDPGEAEFQSATGAQDRPAFREPFRVYEIAEGCTFYVRQGIEQLHKERQVFVKLEDAWLAHLENGLSARDAVWTTPILYFPDGSATDGSAIVVDQDRRFIKLSVRGLTGTVFASPLPESELGSVASN
jgi:hypothetical protein